MSSKDNAYYCPRRLGPGWAQLNIYTNKQYNFYPSHDGMHMAVNMDPSMQYFQIKTIPCSAAYCPQIKEWIRPKRENKGWN
jgi:hypothetical protein